MRVPFLQRFANVLLQRHPGRLDKVAVVLPGKRAGLHLRRYLSEANGGPLWSPEILGVGQFLERTAGLPQGNTMELLFLLHRTYAALLGPEADSLDRFLQWAPATLRDLSEVDAHLLDLKTLYKDLRAYHELEEWSFRLGELSPAQQRANTAWLATGDLHHAFHDRMRNECLATSGYVARVSAERTKQKVDLPWEFIWFAGLNALDPATTATIKNLQEQGRAEVAWDADPFYLDDPRQEAGHYLRRSIAALGAGAVPPQESIRKHPRHIQLVEAPHALAQVAFVAQYLTELSEEDRANTSVVLAQEDLLTPFLERLPAHLGPMNVTMGIPLTSTPIHALTECYLDLLLHAPAHGIAVDRCIALFAHPFVHEEGATERILDGLRSQVRQTIAHDAIAELLHSSRTAHAATITQALRAAQAGSDIALGIAALYDWASHTAPADPVVQEQLLLAGRVQDRMDRLLARAGIGTSDLQLYRAIRDRVLREERLDLLGQAMHGLQVMGALETRTLDHERSIVVGVNEGVLPRTDAATSWIPFDLRKHHGLPMASDAAAVSAYNFQRAMQHPHHVVWTMITGDGKEPGEPSRFVAQWLHEVIGHSPTTLTRSKVAVRTNVRSARPLQVEKDERIMHTLKGICEHGLSPSALGTWLRCPLDFYFKYIARINEQDPALGQLQSNVLGNAVHGALQTLLTPMIGHDLTPALIAEAREQVARQLTDELAREIPRSTLDHGHHRLRTGMAAKALERYLAAEEERCAKEPTRLVAVEREVRATLTNGVVLKGRCDRIDERNGRVTILDVKTGRAKEDDLRLPSLEFSAITPQRQYALQLLTYLWAYLRQNPDVEQASAGVIPLQRPTLAEGMLLKVDGDVVISQHQLPAIESVLVRLVDELLDPSQPFTHDPKSQYCMCCVGSMQV